MKRTRPASMLLRVILRHIDGIVWRRLRVPSTMTLAGLDEMLCLAFGFSGGDRPRHIKAGRKTYESPQSVFRAENGIDHATVTIGDVAKKGSRLVWTYDWIGERWQHDITVEDSRSDPAPELMIACLVEGEGTVPTFYNHLAKTVFESCKTDAKLRTRSAPACAVLAASLQERESEPPTMH